MATDPVSFDSSVIDNKHVVWAYLTVAEQSELLVNYPMRPPATIPVTVPSAGAVPGSAITGVTGDAVDPRFEMWLDTAYLLRHANDNIGDDPTM
jgi:hypothetical protein